MENSNGSVSINAENMFPIIKKWLYSEKDIFVREIVSNAGDAISKLRKLANIGEATLSDDNEWRIQVIYDNENGTLTISDNGIGMTYEEVEKYINQVAFSGAKDFIEKYEGKADGEQIIGHFGLGFYSSFMVSTKVEIDTKSHTGAPAVHWESEDGMNYNMGASELDERGTYITMHLADDAKEYLEKATLGDVLAKYFAFFPYPIYLIDANEPEKEEKETVVGEDGAETEDNADKETEKPINDTQPLWLKAAKDCTDEEYKEFYHKTFGDWEDPLFWIHLNVDYPFNLKGILYFPKLKNRYERFEGQIKVYYNQVFVADNIKEILPEFLMLLKGTIDCPDLPLNVSRSFLQNDGYVAKISQHITKKVADKLNGLMNGEREAYCKYWDDINPFVKFGCLKDEKLYDKVKDSIIYKSTDGEYFTSGEYLEAMKEKTDGKTIYYTDDPTLQAQYVKLLTDRGLKVIVLDGVIDNPFMQFIEYKSEDAFKLARADSDVADTLKDEVSEDDKAFIDDLTATVADDFKTLAKNDKLAVKAEKLSTFMPAMIILSEQARRLQDMMKQYGNDTFVPSGEGDVTLCLNAESSVVKKMLELKKAGDNDGYELLSKQVYDLAVLAHKPMDTDQMSNFIENCTKVLEKAF